jgi:hypothetical protein
MEDQVFHHGLVWIFKINSLCLIILLNRMIIILFSLTSTFGDNSFDRKIVVHVVEFVPDVIKALITTIQSTVVAQVMVGITISISTLTSPQGVWSSINFLQLLMLIPLSEAYLPNNVLNYLYGVDFTLFSLSFIPIEKISVLNDIFDYFKCDQQNENLKSMGLNSCSSIINHFQFTLILILIILIHILLSILYMC